LLGDQTLQRVGEIVTQKLVERNIPPEVQLTESLYIAANKLTESAVSRRHVRRRWLDSFGHLAHHPVFGILIAFFVVYLMYMWVGKIGATLVVDWIGENVFDGFFVPLADRATEKIPWPIVRDMLMDQDFGLIPTGVFLAFGLVMPVLFFFYFAFNILVTLGYLPRLSILLDRVFRVIGLNGKGILPLSMGFSCLTMALITVRMLDSKKEQIIASFLLLLGTPCAPLLAMIFVILAPMSFSATVTFFFIVFSQKILAGMVINKMMTGRTSDFIMVIPPVRIPRVTRVLRHTSRETYYFMREALPLFLLASFALFIVDRLGGLELIEQLSRPLVEGILGLPDSSVQVFIKTMIRRETGAAELELVKRNFDNVQLVVTLIVMTFLVPCVNTMIVLIKERGIRVCLLLLGSVSVYALTVGAVLNWICRTFHVTFT
jgi:ferrous iron transport protein B